MKDERRKMMIADKENERTKMGERAPCIVFQALRSLPPFLLGCATPTTFEGTSGTIGNARAKPLLTRVYGDGDDAQHLPQNAKALRVAHLCRTAPRQGRWAERGTEKS